jgi:L-aminopeptidase/D-esterase-like protein
MTKRSEVVQVIMLSNNELDPLFEGTVQATEEAIINAIVTAENMIGHDGNKVIAIPHDRLRQVLKKYKRLAVTSNY